MAANDSDKAIYRALGREPVQSMGRIQSDESPLKEFGPLALKGSLNRVQLGGLVIAVLD